MGRIALFTSLLLLLTTFRSQAQTPAEDLARVLREKQIITSADYDRIVHAAPGDDVALLKSILLDKGILTNAEVAGIGSHSVSQAGSRAGSEPAPSLATPQPSTQVSNAGEGGQHLTFYGTLLFNTYFNDQATNNADIPLFASPKASSPAENFGATVRQTRLGASYSGQKADGADLSAKLEVDFLGGEPAFTNGISMDLVRLRLAYFRMDWTHFSLEAGQDWTIFAPLNPTSLAEFAIPSLSASGNLWIRTPQLRAEWKNRLGGGNVLWQWAALDPDIGDNAAAYAVARVPKAGELGRLPAVETRFAYSAPIQDRTATLGFSAHWNSAKNTGTIGTEPVALNFESWGVAADFALPVAKRLSLTGEAYGGHALGIFSGGISQTLAAVGEAGDRGIGSRGGWMQAQITLAKKWQSNTAYGIDSPDLRNLITGSRAKNQSYMSNIMYFLSPNVTLSAEWRRFLTNYRFQQLLNNIGDQYNLAAAYTF